MGTSVGLNVTQDGHDSQREALGDLGVASENKVIEESASRDANK